MDFVVEVYAPTWCVAIFKRHVGNWRLQHMKSHDHHVMVQQIMSIGIWNLLQLGPCKTLIRLGIVFQGIYTKVVNQNEMPFAFLWLKHCADLRFGSHLRFLTS